MKKFYLLSLVFIFMFVLSACSSQTEEISTPQEDEQASQEQTENTNQQGEEIKNQNHLNTIEGIEENEEISSPVTISGKTTASKDQLYVELRDSEKNSKVRVYAVVNENEEEMNTYQVTLNFIFSSTSEGYIAVYELDENGKEKNLTELPVRFKTAD